jgi:hypothetical protein
MDEKWGYACRINANERNGGVDVQNLPVLFQTYCACESSAEMLNNSTAGTVYFALLQLAIIL